MIFDYTLAFVAGVAFWVLILNDLHHYLGHKLKGRLQFSSNHLKHHGAKDWFETIRAQLGAMLPIFAVIALIGVVATDIATGLLFAGGFAAGYLVFPRIWHMHMHMAAPKTAYGRWMRKHHFHHHFANPKSNYGLVTPLFDMLWGMYEQPARIAIPERHAMDWLVDPATGKVLPAYEQDYRIVSRDHGEALLDQVDEVAADLDAAYASVPPTA